MSFADFARRKPMSPEAKRYAVYLRKSRADLDAEALGQGETLSRHRAALLELAQKNGFCVAQVYEEIVSGDSIEARPQMLRLLSDVERGRFAGVLCMDIDRLARGDSADQARISRTFRIAKTLIITPSRVYDTTRDSDEEYVDFELFMARREYKAISRRIMRGRIASAREGHFIGSTPPFGYEKVKLEKGRGYTLKPNAESETVRLIFKLCIAGFGRRAIAQRLDDMGLRPRSGRAWSSASIADILRNPVYCGKIRWQYRREEKSLQNGVVTSRRKQNPDCILVQGLHPPLVSESDFLKAQRLISLRREPPKARSAELRNPLSGLVFCGICGAAMTRLGAGAKNRSAILRCPTRGCKNVSAKLSLVESAVSEALSRWVGERRVTVGETPPDDLSAELSLAANRLRAELSVMSAQRENVYTLLEQGVYSPREFRFRIAAVEKRIEELSARLSGTERKQSEGRRLCTQIVPKTLLISEIYAASSAEGKNRLLKAVFAKAVYIKTLRSTRSAPDKSEFSLEIFPLFSGEK